MVRGYDFLVNAVWPEVVANIEARTPSIFAPGNPNVFHQVRKSIFTRIIIAMFSLINFIIGSSIRIYRIPHNCSNYPIVAPPLFWDLETCYIVNSFSMKNHICYFHLTNEALNINFYDINFCFHTIFHLFSSKIMTKCAVWILLIVAPPQILV